MAHLKQIEMVTLKNFFISTTDSILPLQYVCGNWGSDHPRPDSFESYDWFRDKQTKVYSIVRDFLNKNTTHHPKPVQQAKDMFNGCMDTGKIFSSRNSVAGGPGSASSRELHFHKLLSYELPTDN